MKMIKVLCFFTILFSAVIACYAEYSNDPIAEALKFLKEEEKEDFMSFMLGLGLLDWAKSQMRPPKFFPNFNEEIFIGSLNISLENINEFKKFNIPVESRKKLLHWAESEFNLTRKDVLELIRTKKCQGPSCISLGDIGPLCCPW